MKHTNTRHRSATIWILVALTSVIPCATMPFAMLTSQIPAQIQTPLQRAVATAADAYQQRTTLRIAEEDDEKLLQKQARALATIQQQKRTLRLGSAPLQKTITMIGSRYGVVIHSAEDATRLRAQLQQRAIAILRQSNPAPLSFFPHVPGSWVSVLEALLSSSLATGADTHDVLPSPRLPFGQLSDLTLAAQTEQHLAAIADSLATLREQEVPMQQAYAKALAAVTAAQEKVDRSEKLVEQTNDTAINMQTELTRIETRAERTSGQKATAFLGKPIFAWPARGPLAAGFLDPAYEKFFGVPHYGQDILVAQGTPVHSAADGVVFLVRDGGAIGYTYIIVGHRDGYATLYGHLSKTQVSAGQVVEAGDQLGLSGGKPRTPGAGPMTTAPHLHFEVIQNGVNINPRIVLP